MLPVIVDAWPLAIDTGAELAGERIVIGYSDGGVDWAWHETTVVLDSARCLIDLLDRIDDLIVARRDFSDLRY